MLRIYVDGMFFRSSGIGRCYENLLRALDGAEEISRICTVVPRSKEAEFRRAFPSGKIEPRFADFSYLSVSDFLRKGSLLRSFRPTPDLYYFPNVNVPYFWEGKTVSQLHDLIPLSRHSDWPRRHRAAFRHMAARALRKSHRTVCVSEFTKRQAEAEFGVPDDRIRVIPNWLDDSFLRDARTPAGEKPLVEGEYLLYVGNRSAHKNLGTLFAAFRQLAPEFPELKTVVVGARMRARDDVDAAAADPALSGRIVQAPQAGDDRLRNYYGFARAFVFPTFIEGFGIPPLEALAFGVPAVCSDVPAVREICGEAVRYADPRDPESFVRQIRSALTDREMNAAYGAKGAERLLLYRKGSALAKYLELFRECVEGDEGKPAGGRPR